MKKILLLLPALILMLSSCKESNVCRIHGKVANEQLNGKRIFLVPLFGPQTAEYVDSIEVKDGKFEFETDTTMMAKILMDYHFRIGVQTLLVVTEPGDLEVTIDSVSFGHGTPLNDSLQAWKELTEHHNREYALYSRTIRMLQERNLTDKAAKIKQEGDSVHLAYKNRTRQMAANNKGTVLGDFLVELYPLTYKRQMPDGSVVTMNADTNEPISE